MCVPDNPNYVRRLNLHNIIMLWVTITKFDSTVAVSYCSDYLELAATVQLEYFVEIMRFIE